MEFSLLQLFGQSLSAPTGTAPVAAMGFAEFLFAASPPDWPPGPPLLAAADETGKAISIEPNAGESELDPDPNEASQDVLLSAFGLGFLPTAALTAVPNSRPAPLVTSSTPTFTTEMPAIDWSLKPRLNVQVPAWEASRPVFQGLSPIHDFSGHDPAPVPEFPDLQSAPFPQFQAMAKKSFAGASEPLVKVDGFTKQGHGMTFNPQVVEELGLTELKGTKSVQTEVMPSTEVAEAPALILEGLGDSPVSGMNAQPMVDVEGDVLPLSEVDLFESPTRLVVETRSAPVETRIGVVDDQLDLPSEDLPASSKPEEVVVQTTSEPAVRDVSRFRTEVAAPARTMSPEAPFESHRQDVEVAAPIATNIESTLLDPVEDWDTQAQPIDVKASENSSAPILVPQRATSVSGASEPRKAELNPTERAAVLAQTLDRVDRMVIHRPLSQMVIRLMPKELGEITLTIKSVGSRSEATIEASDPRVVHALQAEQPRLNQTLESKGVSLNSLSFHFNERGQQEPAAQDLPKTFVPSAQTEGAPTANPIALDPDSLDLVI